MNRNAQTLRRPVGAIAVLAAAASLVLTGCGGSNGSGASTGGSGSIPTSKASSSSSASTSSSSGSGSTSVVSSGSVPFPIAVGNTWNYKDTEGTSTDTIASVTPVSGGQQVKMDDTITTLGTTSHSSGYFIFHPDGSISYPFSQFNTGSSTTKVTLLSGNIIFPSASDLAAGQVSHSALKIQFTSGGVQEDVTAHITVKGGGTQSVTVPAGTYSASLVEMTMSETIEGIAISSEVKTWFANGVGPVKSEVISYEDGASHILDVNELTSFNG